jgi:hypothetical protein
VKAKTFILREERHREAVREFLDSLPLVPLVQVVFRDARNVRSIAQNSLAHHWYGEEAREAGSTPGEVKLYYKRKFLIDIYRRREDGEFEAMIQSLAELSEKGFRKNAVELYDQIVKMTSTAEASVDEFQEFLNYHEVDARQRGVNLSNPDDLYREALGVKRNREEE